MQTKLRPVGINDVSFAFDLDGTLVDSEAIKEYAHLKTVEFYGGVFGKDFYSASIGGSSGEVSKYMIRQADLNISREEYEKTFHSFYVPEAMKIDRLNPGVPEFLEAAYSGQIPMAVVTSSNTELLTHILRQTNCDHFFQVQVSSDDVINPKPAPDPYLLAKKNLKQASVLLAFEDTDAGTVSAHKAGALVVGIRHGLNKNHSLKHSLKTYSGFDVFTLKDILNVISKWQTK